MAGEELSFKEYLEQRLAAVLPLSAGDAMAILQGAAVKKITYAQLLAAINYTAADVLAKLLTVDGTDSGLDADKLGGVASTRYALKTDVDTSVAALKTAVDISVAGLIDAAPGALDTLNELAAALGDDANFAATITALVTANRVPAGTVIHVAQATPPAGYLKANGDGVQVATYAALAAAIYCGDANNGTALFGYRCNNVDGTDRNLAGAYTVLPDLRGEFVRSWSDSRPGVDVGRDFGTAQADEVIAHVHGLINFVDGDPGFGAAEAGSGVTIGANPTGSYGGVETRPRNIALLACIKY